MLLELRRRSRIGATQLFHFGGWKRSDDVQDRHDRNSDTLGRPAQIFHAKPVTGWGLHEEHDVNKEGWRHFKGRVASGVRLDDVQIL